MNSECYKIHYGPCWYFIKVKPGMYIEAIINMSFAGDTVQCVEVEGNGQLSNEVSIDYEFPPDYWDTLVKTVKNLKSPISADVALKTLETMLSVEEEYQKFISEGLVNWKHTS